MKTLTLKKKPVELSKTANRHTSFIFYLIFKNCLYMTRKQIMLIPTKKPIAMTGFDVTVEFCLSAGIPIERLSNILLSVSTISKTLSIAARYAVRFGLNCACISKKHIYSFCYKRGYTAHCPTDCFRASL